MELYPYKPWLQYRGETEKAMLSYDDDLLEMRDPTHRREFQDAIAQDETPELSLPLADVLLLKLDLAQHCCTAEVAA